MVFKAPSDYQGLKLCPFLQLPTGQLILYPAFLGQFSDPEDHRHYQTLPDHRQGVQVPVFNRRHYQSKRHLTSCAFVAGMGGS